MTVRDPQENVTRQPDCCPGAAQEGTDWLIPASLGLTFVVAVSGYIIYYLFFVLPAGCLQENTSGQGVLTCSAGLWTYIIALMCLVLIIIGIYTFVRWNLTRCRSKKTVWKK